MWIKVMSPLMNTPSLMLSNLAIGLVPLPVCAKKTKDKTRKISIKAPKPPRQPRIAFFFASGLAGGGVGLVVGVAGFAGAVEAVVPDGEVVEVAAGAGVDAEEGAAAELAGVGVEPGEVVPGDTFCVEVWAGTGAGAVGSTLVEGTAGEFDAVAAVTGADGFLISSVYLFIFGVFELSLSPSPISKSCTFFGSGFGVVSGM